MLRHEDLYEALVERQRVRLRFAPRPLDAHWQLWERLIAALDAKPPKAVRQKKTFDWETAAALGAFRRQERDDLDAR